MADVILSKESELLALVSKMITGYTKNKRDYPRADAKRLKAEVADLLSADDALAAAKKEHLRAGKDKKQKLETLRKSVREHIKDSKFDTGDDPEKLRAIGVDTAPKRASNKPPAAPRLLEIADQKPKLVHLKWKLAVRQTGSPALGYIVRRRELKDGNITEWCPHATVFTNEAKLEGEGKGHAYEYLVVATNRAGESDPSNTVAVLV